MICGSPRHSDWLMPRWIAPVPPAMIAVPMTSSQSEGPCPRPEVTFWSLTDVEGAWNFSPRGENQIFWNERIVLSEPRFQSPLPRAGSASCGKGGRTALSRPRSSGPCHLPGAADTSASSWWKQEEAEARTVRWSLTNTPCGRPRTKQTVLKK